MDISERGRWWQDDQTTDNIRIFNDELVAIDLEQVEPLSFSADEVESTSASADISVRAVGT